MYILLNYGIVEFVEFSRKRVYSNNKINGCTT